MPPERRLPPGDDVRPKRNALGGRLGSGAVIPIKDNIPTDRFPFVTVALILANVVVYLLAIRHGGSFFSGPDTQEVVKYGAIPYTLTHNGAHCAEFAQQTLAGTQPIGVFCNGQLLPDGSIAHIASNALPTWETVFTSMFMHGSFLHIAGNMLFLWIFGNNVEDSMGPVKFIFFYLPRRDRGARAAGRDRPELDGADDRRLGRDRGGARRLHRAVSARAGADARVHHLLRHRDRAAGAS